MPKCEHCGKEISSEEGLLQHMRDSHGIGRQTKHDIKEQKKEEKEKQRETEAKKQKSSKMMRNGAIALVVILIIAGIAYFALTSKSGNNYGTLSVNIPSYAGFLGSQSAGVNIIEFGDYQCPVCASFFVDSEQQMMNEYVNANKARFYFLDLSFLGPDSITLSQGSWCANEQGKYYEYHDYVYGHQGRENSGWATPDKVKAMVANIPGLDTSAFNSCLNSNKYTSRLNELTQLGQTSGVTGTPTFYIGNSEKGYVQVVGPQYSQLKHAIDQELAG